MARLVLAGAGATGGLMIDLGAARKGSEVTVVKAVDGGGGGGCLGAGRSLLCLDL